MLFETFQGFTFTVRENCREFLVGAFSWYPSLQVGVCVLCFDLCWFLESNTLLLKYQAFYLFVLRYSLMNQRFQNIKLTQFLPIQLKSGGHGKQRETNTYNRNTIQRNISQPTSNATPKIFSNTNITSQPLFELTERRATKKSQHECSLSQLFNASSLSKESGTLVEPFTLQSRVQVDEQALSRVDEMGEDAGVQRCLRKNDPKGPIWSEVLIEEGEN